jgi:hypothetical protein
MRRKTLINRIKGMTNERKVLALSSILTFAACFMPWYGINSRVINEWWNAFGSIGSVAGYLVLAFALTSLTLLALPVATQSEISIGKHLPFKESSLLIFLQGQSFFVTLLFIPIYSQYSLINATNSGTRFGLYVALLSTLAGTLFAIAQHRKGEPFQSSEQSFPQVPQTHRSLNEWDDETTDSFETEEDTDQEEMFDKEVQPVAATESSTFSPYQDNNQNQGQASGQTNDQTQDQSSRFDPYQQ